VDLAAGSDHHEGRVDADAAVAFALATNDHNQRYLRGELVPPLFTAAMILPASWEAQERGGGRDWVRGASGSVHGEHDVFYYGVITPGMALRWHAGTYGARQTRGGVVVSQRILVTDDHGAPMVEHFWSNFYIAGSIEGALGAAAPDHTFPDDARSRPFGSRTLVVDRDQAFRYAGVSRDHAGHAIDDEIARQEGYPSKILQGMCTFALCSGAAVDIGSGGDTSRLRRLAGRFSAPAFPNRDLVVTMYDAGRTAEGARALAFEAVQDGVTVIKHGLAEFSPEAAGAPDGMDHPGS
jgi:acyl dehydratase